MINFPYTKRRELSLLQCLSPSPLVFCISLTIYPVLPCVQSVLSNFFDKFLRPGAASYSSLLHVSQGQTPSNNCQQLLNCGMQQQGYQPRPENHRIAFGQDYQLCEVDVHSMPVPTYSPEGDWHSFFKRFLESLQPVFKIQNPPKRDQEIEGRSRG